MKPTSLKCVTLLLLVFGWMALKAAAQGPGQHSGDPQYTPAMGQPVENSITHNSTMLEDAWQRNENPFKPGNTLKSSEINCGIIEWDDSPPKPVLTVVCPPPEIFTPLRVFLKFSWIDAKDVPKDAAKVVAAPKTGTKILLDRANIKVFLKVSKGSEDSAKEKEKWLAFNALQGFAIIPTAAAGPHHQ
jgi:hypothetical protein